MDIELKDIDKEELHNIGECLLDCIYSHRHEGYFDERCYWYDGKQPWSYNKDRYLVKLVCELFDLNYEYQLENYGYAKEE